MFLSKLVAYLRRPFAAQRAHREAVYLAQCIWRRHYRDRAPQWAPLDDTAGVISQIDNMHAGIADENQAIRTAALVFAAKVVMLGRQRFISTNEREIFETACAELTQALSPKE